MVLSGPISQALEGPGEDRVSDLDFLIYLQVRSWKTLAIKPDVVTKSAEL